MLEVARSVAFLRMEKKSHKVVRPEPRYVEAEYRQTRPASRAKLMEVVKTAGKGMVPRAGVEPARPFGQRILSLVISVLPNLTKRYKPVFPTVALAFTERIMLSALNHCLH